MSDVWLKTKSDVPIFARKVVVDHSGRKFATATLGQGIFTYTRKTARFTLESKWVFSLGTDTESTVDKWRSLVFDKSAETITAVASDDLIYKSYNGGVSFQVIGNDSSVANQTLPRSLWTGVASDASGRHLYACTGTPSFDSEVSDWSLESNNDIKGDIYASKDFGVTWRSLGSDSANSQAILNCEWAAIVTDYSGQYVAAITISDFCRSGAIYLSDNFGELWALSSAPTGVQYSAIAMSATGKRMVASSSNGDTIYLSDDFGLSWSTARVQGGGGSELTEESSMMMRLTSVALDSTGAQIVVATSTSILSAHETGSARISDGSALGTTGAVSAIGSPDGMQINSGTTDSVPSRFITPKLTNLHTSGTTGANEDYEAGGVFISENFGSSWRESSLPRVNWRSVACNAAGDIIVAAPDDGLEGVFILDLTPGDNDDFGSIGRDSGGSSASSQRAVFSSSVAFIIAIAVAALVTLGLAAYISRRWMRVKNSRGFIATATTASGQGGTTVVGPCLPHVVSWNGATYATASATVTAPATASATVSVSAATASMFERRGSIRSQYYSDAGTLSNSSWGQEDIAYAVVVGAVDEHQYQHHHNQYQCGEASPPTAETGRMQEAGDIAPSDSRGGMSNEGWSHPMVSAQVDGTPAPVPSVILPSPAPPSSELDSPSISSRTVAPRAGNETVDNSLLEVRADCNDTLWTDSEPGVTGSRNVLDVWCESGSSDRGGCDGSSYSDYDCADDDESLLSCE